MALVLNLVVSLYLGYIMLGYHDTSRESAMIVREVVIYVRNLVVELATSDDG